MKLLIFWVCLQFCNRSMSENRFLLTSFPGKLVAYLIGLPILGYSLDIGKEHVNLIDDQLQKLIYSGQLDQKEIDR